MSRSRTAPRRSRVQGPARTGATSAARSKNAAPTTAATETSARKPAAKSATSKTAAPALAAARTRAPKNTKSTAGSLIQYVALLRGINVGGRNPIKMTELKACFEKHGLRDVVTYIQSGNVLFASPETDTVRLTTELEKLLAAEFGYEASLVLRSLKQMKDVVARAPTGFGARPDAYRYDAIFLKEPLVAADAMKSVPLDEQADQAWPGTGVLYFSRLIAKASQSRLARLTSMAIYRSMTIRNWNTTTKLLSMMRAR